MATNLENVPISDNAAATRKIVGQEFVQGADTLFAQGVIPLQTIVEETTGISLSTSNTDTAISPLANLVVIDFGTNDPASTIALSGQHRSGGDFHKVDYWYGGPQDNMPQRRNFDGNSQTSTLHLWRYTTALDGARIVYVPAAGLQTIRLAVSAGTLADVRIIQLCTPAMPPRPPRGPLFGYAIGDFTIGNTLYTTGDAIDTVAPMLVATVGPQFNPNATTVKIKTFSGADYEGILTDFDLVIAPGVSIGDQTDNAAFDFDYGEAIVAWFEMRTTPTGDQIPIREFGATGGRGWALGDLDIHVPYGNVSGTSYRAFDVFAIDRSGMTGTPTTVFMEAQVEM